MTNNDQNIFKNFPLATELLYSDLRVRSYAKKYVLLYNNEVLWVNSINEIKKNKRYIKQYNLYDESDTFCIYREYMNDLYFILHKNVKLSQNIPNIVNKIIPSKEVCIEKIKEEIDNVLKFLENILDKDIVSNFNIKKFESKHLSFNSILQCKGPISVFCLHNYIKNDPQKYENIIKNSSIYTKYNKALNYEIYKSEKEKDYILRLYITYLLFMCIEHVENYKNILQLCLNKINKNVNCLNSLDISYLTFDKIRKYNNKIGNEILRINMDTLSVEKSNGKYYSCDCIQFKYADNKWNVQFISSSNKELDINKVMDNVKMTEFENSYIKHE